MIYLHLQNAFGRTGLAVGAAAGTQDLLATTRLRLSSSGSKCPLFCSRLAAYGTYSLGLTPPLPNSV